LVDYNYKGRIYYFNEAENQMDIFSVDFTASDLTAAVATNVQTTVASLAPVLELVVGIVLGFIVIRYVIGLFKHTGRTSSR